MSFNQKRRHYSSPLASVSVEIDDESEDEKPATPKRGRGRPKATPASVEFKINRPPPSDTKAPSHLRFSFPATQNSPTPVGREAQHPHKVGPRTPSPFNHFPDDDSDPGGDEPETTNPTYKNTPNGNLREWLDLYSVDYLETAYARDAPPSSIYCTRCDNRTENFYRCTSCIGAGALCSSCAISLHQHSPTHRLRSWDGVSWVETNLSALGLILFLGHDGKPCSASRKASNLYVGDLNGFSRIRVQYCKCEGAMSRARQLLCAGLFPCSHGRPQSAFALPVLDMYDILTSHSRTSAHKYYSALERLTNPGLSGNVDDRYRELMWTHRRFHHLLLLRRTGYKFPKHPDIDVHPGDQSVDCMACPRPGINFEWDEIPPEELIWFRIWLSYDGNFRSMRKKKPVDADDICLSDDLGYFSLKELYKKWADTLEKLKRHEKPTCNHHKAGQELTVRWVGQDVTGVGAFSCARHTCVLPRGVVDFFKGEKFGYSDFALGALLSHINKRRGASVPIGITYDVWCHWIINFATRVAALPPSVAIPEGLDLVGAVPKWHLVGHNRECFVRWSLDNMQHVGRLDGEGPERFWSHMNQHSGSTSEQSPGLRTDTLNHIMRVWNEEKAFGLHKSIPPRYEHAKKMLAAQKEAYDEMVKPLPSSEIARWEAEPIEPVQGRDKQWTSPLMDPVFDGGFYDTMKAEREQEASTARVPGRRPGATRWLSDGIELEHSVRNFNDEAKELGDSPTTQRANNLNAKRLSLRDRIDAHRQKRELYMGQVEVPDAPRVLQFHEELADDEAFDIGMPSSYSPEMIKTAALETLAEVERELRRAMCKESLESVKRLLGAKKASYRFKKRHTREQVPVTRANAALKAQDLKIHKAQWRYANSRDALFVLGPADADAAFEELKDEDLTALTDYYAEYATRLGHGYDGAAGYKGISWIWKSSVAPNTEEWEVLALKTEWFRARERYKRWEEELVLLKREMVMTIRSFLKYQELWEWRASRSDISQGMRAYAYGQSRFYAQHANRMAVSCRKELFDKTVELKWSDNWVENNVIVHDKTVVFVEKK